MSDEESTHLLEEVERRMSEDQDIPEDEFIDAAHPLETKRFDLHNEAMRLVGAKHSKGALVDLVNWLLHRIDAAEQHVCNRVLTDEDAKVIAELAQLDTLEAMLDIRLPRESGCSEWCALKRGGTTCDCDWFEQQARGFGEGPKGYRAIVVKWPLQVATRPRCDCDLISETLKKLKAAKAP